MAAAADRLDFVAGLDAEGDDAAFEPQHLRGGGDAQPDRGRRGMAHVKMNAEALMAGGKRCSTAANAAASITLIITGVANTAIRPDPTNGAVCSGPTTISAEPESPGLIRARTELMRGGVAMPPYSANLRHGVAPIGAIMPRQSGDYAMPRFSRRSVLLCVTATVIAILPSAPSFALTAKEKMVTCKFGADDQKLQGAARAKFLKNCMADRNDPRGPATGAPATTGAAGSGAMAPATAGAVPPPKQ